MKTYRVTKKITSYSKKKGSYQQNIVVAKNFLTVDAAKEFILKEYPKAEFKLDGNKLFCRVSGFLAPTYIYIL